HPFLEDHRVTGTPTLPASFGLDIAARTACSLRPERRLRGYLDVAVDRFVQIPDGRTFNLRSVADLIEEDDRVSRVRVRLMSDFVHSSGRVLQADVVHMTADVVRATAPADPVITHDPVTPVHSGWHLADPYLHPDAPVRLGGP